MIEILHLKKELGRVWIGCKHGQPENRLCFDCYRELIDNAENFGRMDATPALEEGLDEPLREHDKIRRAEFRVRRLWAERIVDAIEEIIDDFDLKPNGRLYIDAVRCVIDLLPRTLPLFLPAVPEEDGD